ncbi:MAG: HslU--HslV peptidase proteolytic subunit, partial [Candidatus Adiutrix sp.]
GSGDVLEPDDGLLARGSGGSFALAAARAVVTHNPQMGASAICEESMKIAADICIYTNNSFTLEVL